MKRSTVLLAATLICAIPALPPDSRGSSARHPADPCHAGFGGDAHRHAPSSRMVRRAWRHAEKVYDTLDFTRGLDAFLNSYGGASAYAIRKGLLSIGAEDNTVTIYPELMDAKSLFLTANADTVYYFSIVDLTKGPMVVEQPPKGLGTINDMWFAWIIDVGFPGPDRGEGGRYLLLPPGYDGPVPEGGFYVARSKTTRVIYAARAFLADNDPKPAVENIKKTIKIYPYTPGGFGTSIATALEGKVRLEAQSARSADQVRGGQREMRSCDSAKRLLVLRDDQRRTSSRSRPTPTMPSLRDNWRPSVS